MNNVIRAALFALVGFCMSVSSDLQAIIIKNQLSKSLTCFYGDNQQQVISHGQSFDFEDNRVALIKVTIDDSTQAVFNVLRPLSNVRYLIIKVAGIGEGESKKPFIGCDGAFNETGKFNDMSIFGQVEQE